MVTARPALLSAAAALAAACAAPAPRRVAYSDYTLIIASPALVDRACQPPAARWDDGRKIRWDESSAGCWKPAEREIWVRWDEAGAKALPHELCHKDGKLRCEAYDWPR